MGIFDFIFGKTITIEDVLKEETGEALLDYVMEVASGKQTKARQLRQDDFIPWKRGMSL